MRHILLVCVILLFITGLVSFEYQLPGEVMVDIFDRPYTPAVSFLHKHHKIIYHDFQLYMPLEWLAQDIVQYGEINIYERSRSRPRTTFFSAFHIADMSSVFPVNSGSNAENLQFTRLALPQDSAFGHEAPSYSQHAMLILEYCKDKIVLWHVDSTTLETKILLDGGLTQVSGDVATWFPDNQNVLVRLIPDGMEKPQLESNIPVGPVVMETTGNESRNITRPNLLQNAHEEDLFEYYATVQLGVINTITGELKKIGKPGLISLATVSPNGRYVLIHEYERPFSKSAPYWMFPARWYVLDLQTNTTTELVKHGFRELNFGHVQSGKRWFAWHPFMDASLIILSALDGGNPDNQAAFRDEIRILNAPFKGNGNSLLKSVQRLNDITFADRNTFIYSEFEFRTNTVTTYLVNSRNRQHQISKRHIREIYDHPGEPITYTTDRGQEVIFMEKGQIYLMGDGQARDSRVPFIDALNVNTFTKQRVAEFKSDDFIQLMDLYNNNPNLVLMRKQNAVTPINIFMTNTQNKAAIALTNFEDTVPEFTRLQKRVINYPREDGVELSGTLYLPENYDGSERLPLLMSAYPREFLNAQTASQSARSDNRYTRPFGSSNFYMCLHNIAVLVDAAFPIIGDTETVNNTFIEQSILNAKAAIDYLDTQGIVDRDQVVIQGHSYGAFMVLNLMVHSDLFAGGIAQNGAYNRTLTPFGFQSERRTLWQARDTYINLSPFLYANQIQKPLLLIHSTNDTNSGTFPIQSRRLYEALDGLGKNARYVQLPLEEHNYRARETHLHILWEYKRFFDQIRN